MKYFIAVVSKDHVCRGVNGGFMQACHGKQAPLKRMKKGDKVIFYSPKISMEGTEKLQCFTAIGEANDDLIYTYEMSPSFTPYRRNITFFSCKEVSIIPLIDELDFIEDKTHWGYKFRFGFLEISESDYKKISREMFKK